MYQVICEDLILIIPLLFLSFLNCKKKINFNFNEKVQMVKNCENNSWRVRQRLPGFEDWTSIQIYS